VKTDENKAMSIEVRQLKEALNKEKPTTPSRQVATSVNTGGKRYAY